MNTRRGILVGLLAGVGSFAACRGRIRRDDARGRGADAAELSYDRRFVGDFREATSRAYSEEGIPMFLVGENLAPRAKVAGRVGAGSSRELGEWLATEVTRGAAALERWTGRPVGDSIAKIVEVLAARDFGAFRKGGGR